MYYIYTQTIKEIKRIPFGFLVMQPVFFIIVRKKPFVDNACSLLKRIFLFDKSPKMKSESGY